LMLKGMAKRVKDDLETFRRDIETDLGNRPVDVADFTPAAAKVTKEMLREAVSNREAEP